MSTSVPFAFGVEQTYQFTGINIQPPPPGPAAPEPPVKVWVAKAAALEAEVRLEQALVAALHRQAMDRDAELASSRAVCSALSAELKTAQRAESIARDLARNLYDQNMKLEQQEDTYEHIAWVESNHKKAEEELREEKLQHNKLQGEHNALSAESRRQQQEIRIKEEEIDRLESKARNLDSDYVFYLNLSQQLQEDFDKKHAELESKTAECKDAIAAREKTLKVSNARDLENDELRAELQKQEYIDAQLRLREEDVNALEETIFSLQQDIDDSRNHQDDLDHVVKIKDMRIAQLEKDLQKAHKQALAAAEAAAAATEAAISSDDYLPPMFNNTAGGSLEDELAASSDFGDDESIYEPRDELDFGPIYFVDTQPAGPASVRKCTVAFGEHISVVPIKALTPVLRIGVEEVASITPIVRQIKTVDGDTQTDAPALTTSVVHSASISVASIKVQQPCVVTVITSAPESRLTRFLRFSLPVLVGILSISCLYLHAQLQDWRNANGWASSYEDTFSSGGAYGNARKLFGLFDIANSIGNSDVTESIARTMSTAITHFEQWTGSTYNPHY